MFFFSPVIFHCHLTNLPGGWFIWILKWFVSGAQSCAGCRSSGPSAVLQWRKGSTQGQGPEGRLPTTASPCLLPSAFQRAFPHICIFLLHVYTDISCRISRLAWGQISWVQNNFLHFFPKVSTVLQGRILIWCYMDPGGCVRLQTQLHLPQLQGFSEQVGGLRSINRVYRSTLQFMERGGTKHTATVYSGNLLEPQGPALLTS